MKLIYAAIKLLHKKEKEAFIDLCDAFNGTYTPSNTKYSFKDVWRWGRKRWKTRWCNLEYEVRERQFDILETLKRR